MRKLAYDGVPIDRLYSSDIIPQYEAVGHALFRDEEKFKGRFITADLFDESPDSALVKTAGSWNVINIMMFLHSFTWNKQILACKRILQLLSKQPGSMIVGAQSATTEAGEVLLKGPLLKEGVERPVFRHSKESFRKMWQEVMESEGEKLKVWVDYRSRKEDGDGNGDSSTNKDEMTEKTKTAHFFPDKEGTLRRMLFVVERL